jgi:ABC-type sugar transport system substrate-binding protein
MNDWVAVALLSDEQEFQRLQAEDARAAAAAGGLQAQVVFAENNAVLQIQQLYKFVRLPAEERPLAIVVETVVGEGLERLARAAVSAGIGWILINRSVGYLEALRREHPRLAIGTVGTDQREVGRIQGRQFRALLPHGTGSVIYLQGPPDTSVAQQRLQGAEEAIRGSQVSLKILTGLWTEPSGAYAIKQWLRLKSTDEVHVVGCQNDAMAVGARNALVEAGDRPQLARLPVTGCDGLPAGGQRLVDARQLAATVITPPNTGPAIRLLAKSIATRSPFPAETLLAPASYPPEATLAARSRLT